MLCNNIMTNPLDLAASAGQRGVYAAGLLVLLWLAIAWAMSA